MHWRIRAQTVILSLVPLFFLALLFALALAMVNTTLDVASWSQRSAQIVSEDDLAMRSLAQMGQSLTTYAADHKPTSLRGYHAGAIELGTQLSELRRLTADEARQKAPVIALTRDMDVALIVLRDYAGDLKRGDTGAAKALGTAPATKRLSLALSQDSNEVSTVQRNVALRYLESARRTQQTFGVALLLCCLAGIVLTLGTAWAFGFRVVRRLRALAANAQRMAAGQEPSPIDGSDEIAELNGVYLEMTRRIQQEHQIATTLQRALLPSDLPRVDGLRIDTAYMPASLDAEVGGDWYDVFALSDSRIGISVGDVAGHGLKAASVMGITRHTIRTAARIDADAGRVLGHVNRSLMRDEEDMVVTALVGILDLDDGMLRYAIAGHPGPLVIRHGGKIERPDVTGLILGVNFDARFETHELQLEAGSGLVLFTDGIIEVERNYQKGMQDLEAALADAYDSAPNIAEAVQRRIFERAAPRDDSAVLVVRIEHLRVLKAWSLDAREALATRRVKRALIEELERMAAGCDYASAELILGELLSNVARHTPGLAEVSLEWSNGSALLHVADRGKPFFLNGCRQPDLLAESGRGLFLVTSVSGGVRVEQIPDGNRVTAILPMSCVSQVE